MFVLEITQMGVCTSWLMQKAEKDPEPSLNPVTQECMQKHPDGLYHMYLFISWHLSLKSEGLTQVLCEEQYNLIIVIFNLIIVNDFGFV